MKVLYLLALLSALGCSQAAFLLPCNNHHGIDHTHRSLIPSPSRRTPVLRKASFHHEGRESKLVLRVGEVKAGEGSETLAPSVFFLLSAASLGKLFFDIQDSSLPMTVGMWALWLTTAAVGYDNFIIGIGKPFFKDAETNKQEYNLLKILSYPRFTAHAVLVPFLYSTGAEIGRAMGVQWLQSDSIQSLVIIAAAVLGIVSRVRFVNSPGIEIKDTSDSPPEAWERSLLWFTYKKPEFLYVVPSIILALFNLAIGAASFNGDERAASVWMIISAVSVLYGNAKPEYVKRFTGNLAEVIMLWSIYEAASLVLK